jgi:2-polyprenyl-6-methoxyphenol hydroxylase-like FAD-dependent oxidoreductase
VHAEPITGGHGANVAILDGVGLAECIAKHGSAGISNWYNIRYSSWAQGVKNSEKMITEIHADPISVL